MVKKWIIMIALLLVLLVGCVLESNYVNNSFKELINQLEVLQINLTENKESIDKKEFIDKSFEIHEGWHKKAKLLKCLIWHTGIKDAEIGLARISVYIQENNYEEASAEIASLIDYLAHYSDDFVISWENIF